VHRVFDMHAFYLPHPNTAEPMLVMDTSTPGHPARKSFFTTYGATET
jgi:hypothetical protein